MSPSAAGNLPPASKPPALPSVGTLHSTKHPDIAVVVNEATRSTGGLLTVRWTIVNHSKEAFSQGTFETGAKDDMSVPCHWSGVLDIRIVDHVAGQRYYPMNNNHSGCLVYDGGDGTSVPPGGQLAVFDMYRPVSMPSNLEVTILNFGTLKNVPVTSS
jgi:hypothetical protein